MAKKNAEKQSIITIKVARGLITLYNAMYKLGVMDAEQVGSDGICEEFSEQVRVPTVYGRVTDGYTMSQKEWCATLMRISAKWRVNDDCQRFLAQSFCNNTYFTCALPIAQEFYIKGMEDFNAYPHIHDFTNFDNSKMERWTRNGIVSWTRKEIFIELQMLCFQRQRIDNDSDDRKALKGKRYEWFASDLWARMTEGGMLSV